MAIILSAVDRNRVGDKSGTLLQMASAFSRSGLSVLLIGDEPHAWASSIPGLALLRGSRDLPHLDPSGPAATRLHTTLLRDDLQSLADRSHLILVDNPLRTQLCKWSYLASSDFMLCLAEDHQSERCLSIRMVVNSALRNLGDRICVGGATQDPGKSMSDVLGHLLSGLDTSSRRVSATDVSGHVPAEDSSQTQAGDCIRPLTALSEFHSSRRAA